MEKQMPQKKLKKDKTPLKLPEHGGKNDLIITESLEDSDFIQTTISPGKKFDEFIRENGFHLHEKKKTGDVEYVVLTGDDNFYFYWYILNGKSYECNFYISKKSRKNQLIWAGLTEMDFDQNGALVLNTVEIREFARGHGFCVPMVFLAIRNVLISLQRNKKKRPKKLWVRILSYFPLKASKCYHKAFEANGYLHEETLTENDSKYTVHAILNDLSETENSSEIESDIENYEEAYKIDPDRLRGRQWDESDTYVLESSSAKFNTKEDDNGAERLRTQPWKETLYYTREPPPRSTQAFFSSVIE